MAFSVIAPIRDNARNNAIVRPKSAVYEIALANHLPGVALSVGYYYSYRLSRSKIVFGAGKFGNMLNDFSAEYSQRSDDELLHLASQRHFLTTEAAAALDDELRGRNLTESDRLDHQRFVKRQEQREARAHRRRKTFGPFKYQMSWRDMLGAFAAIALISVIYIVLPSRYHMKSEWQEAAFLVMMTSVLITAALKGVFFRNLAFWISLAISSAIHLLVVHAFTQRIRLNRGAGKGAAVTGLLLFFAVYKLVGLLQRMLHNEQGPTMHSDSRLSS